MGHNGGWGLNESVVGLNRFAVNRFPITDTKSGAALTTARALLSTLGGKRPKVAVINADFAVSLT
jgi:hypothetical protein